MFIEGSLQVGACGGHEARTAQGFGLRCVAPPKLAGRRKRLEIKRHYVAVYDQSRSNISLHKVKYDPSHRIALN